jgi:putative flippase GtrA
MSEDSEAAVAQRPVAVHVRVRAGLRRSHNWVQLVKFCAVGGTGYAVNLVVFALSFEVLHLHHLVAATCAFVVAVLNNFWWNRHWTFKVRRGRAGFQAARFFAVSIAAFVLAASILELLVSVFGVAAVLAQAISIVAATPLNFAGNKMWTFALELERD